VSIITIDVANLDQEHICCAISEKKGETCVALKKAWLKERMAEGLVFKKLDERGKVFIEYIPAEYAWHPIEAPGYININCFWVSGRYKGQGYANELLAECIADAKAKGKAGLVVLSSEKKRPFLSDPNFLKYKGFIQADTALPYFQLFYLPFDQNAPVPQFKNCAKAGKIDKTGMVLYYSDQCPFTDKYAHIIAAIARERGSKIELNKIISKEQAQNAPSPVTNYSFFDNGEFITNEIFSEKKFHTYLDEKGQ
jgi:GNAT superfamily N-acetyltransferase